MSTSLGNLSSVGSYDPTTANAPKLGANTMGTSSKEIQDNFMRMLITQLQNQNPLNPMDNAQFASQLAQMSQLQGIESMRGSIDSFVKQVQSGRLLEQSNLVGRQVMAASESVQWNGTDAVNFAVNADSTLADAVLRIKSFDGRVLDEIKLGTLGSDMKGLSWDGTDKEGAPLLPGKYLLTVDGIGSDGRASTGNVLTPAQVTSVRRAGNDIEVDLSDGRSVLDSQILQVGA
jgi:flagellar basal-body rod modification protein FlgD